jgi:alpha-tubulin suppressor-like RCC1 family protein
MGVGRDRPRFRGLLLQRQAGDTDPRLAGIKAVSAGTTHFLALTTDRRARKIGCFSNDETCLPDFGFSDVIAIASGVDHALVLRADGSVWGLGGNAFGQVGNGTTTPVLNAPARVSVSNVVAIAAGGTFSAAIRANGTVVVWGYLRVPTERRVNRGCNRLLLWNSPDRRS